MTDSASEPLAMLRAFIAEVNGGKIPAALARFTADAAIVEDIAPFFWSGPQAAGQWLAAMGANAARLGVESIAMTAGEPQRIEVEGEHCYCILPGRVSLRGPEVALAEEGLITFALRRESGEWRIAALTWSGSPPEPE